jgi:hypothetical protein
MHPVQTKQLITMLAHVKPMWKASRQAVSNGKRHERVHEPPDMDKTYRVCTDHEAIVSVMPRREVNDTAANAFVPQVIICGKPKKAVMVYTHFYKIVAEGFEVHTVQSISDQFLLYIESVYPQGLLDVDMLIVPIHKPGHWQLGIVDFKHKRFEFYDSLYNTKRKDVCAPFAGVMTQFLNKYFSERMEQLGYVSLFVYPYNSVFLHSMMMCTGNHDVGTRRSLKRIPYVPILALAERMGQFRWMVPVVGYSCLPSPCSGHVDGL